MFHFAFPFHHLMGNRMSDLLCSIFLSFIPHFISPSHCSFSSSLFLFLSLSSSSRFLPSSHTDTRTQCPSAYALLVMKALSTHQWSSIFTREWMTEKSTQVTTCPYEIPSDNPFSLQCVGCNRITDQNTGSEWGAKIKCQNGMKQRQR